MEKVISALNEIKKINSAYEISTEAICKLLEEIEEAKVCTPIIGKFSSGKSALINTILGYNRRILKEDITPETAIPTEIVYSSMEDVVNIVSNKGEHKVLSVNDYRSLDTDANTVRSARVQLINRFLGEIPDVMIVDMPGFESGFEIHNKAIDNYLPQSLAYIIAFPADDMIVRSSVGNILKELCLHDMPLCVVITKYDKRNDDFDATFEKMKESLRRFVGDREIRYCKTSSFDGNAEELEEFLREIQEKSQDLLGGKYKKSTLSILDNTENYLKTTLNNSQLSESELDEQEEKLNRQLSSLDSKFSKDKDDFELEISECISEIKSDIKMALEAEESTFVAMIINGQNINEQLNIVVRRAVTVSVQKRFISRVESYLKKVEKTISGESIGDVHITFNFDSEKLNKSMTTNIVAVAAAFFIAGPIFGTILGLIASKFLKRQEEKKRAEVKQEIKLKLRNEVFPQVIRELGGEIERTITKEIKLVNTSIEEDLTDQRQTLEKAMSDVRSKINDERSRKKNLEEDINNDLERIGEIKYGL